MDKREALQEFIEDKVKNCKDEYTERELKQVLRKMKELEAKEKIYNRMYKK